ncbi:Integrase [Acidisarcina polymorpha]|uniref:Integrase n=1 Tax=Acidisarcina polymorpha TaxID=2211140 RepID=A0A2Z5FT79_9BACT|nr:site-specific integrase [Acidisarcina polymorpha]AXC09635.1 Integrase [Acidisarcina polymorpha]
MPKAKVRDGVFQRIDRPGWWVSFVDATGARKKVKVQASTRTQALTALQGFKTKAQQERILGVKHTSDITVEALFVRYKRHQKMRIRPTTFERLDTILKTLVSHLPSRAKDITKRIVSEFISERSTEVAAGTVTKEMSVLKHALKLAVEWELLHENPALGAKLPRIPEGRTRYLTPLELKMALEAAPEWMRAPIAMAAFTGMRRGELLSLRWIDVDIPNRRLYLRETKNGSLRVLVLNELAALVLMSLPVGQPSGPVFGDVDAHKLTVYTRRLFGAVGIQDASFHSLRHTHASWLAMEGVNLHTIGQMLGHRTPRMTTRYAHLSPEYMAISAGKLDRVFGDVLPVNNAQTEEKGRTLVPTESPL